ncbi:sensor histidine kinase [Methylovirgula sp. 4M-Z18]|uniref:sensor histidine kinase n=1 Tax=Methylovirgula sp. 4M-Z18 TaxID=2293567 RepID=UPI000E2FE631|nr:HAMP domain-containing sensor histidine kinase [Methylovirgula sp. 4M-Z18]RFB76321.1 sensor histidine kinase [Methylovirgula sp. 4M-Z18]
MTALGRIFRTTAFKLSLAYLVIFAIGAGLVLGSVALNLRRIFDDQVAETIDAEIKGLSEQYEIGGITGLVDVIERRLRRPGSSLYLVRTAAGESIAGNVCDLPNGLLTQPGLVVTAYQPCTGDSTVPHHALVSVSVLPGGFRLLIGRDLGERDEIRSVIIRAQFTNFLYLLVIGTAGGLFVAWRILRRVDAMNAAARTIMMGNMSGRLPVAGSQDELDRLAENLNAMLERISELMSGLREVSDNIAHDLKTPLTRLRNDAEQALRSAASPDEYRHSLEKIIDESDGLIRIFNALLMIARVESGASKDVMVSFDMAEVVHSVAELYEPVAEEAGARLDVDAMGPARVYGSRELIGQALVNLVENALKYGLEGGGSASEPLQIGMASSAETVDIWVGDHGPGIRVDDREHVLSRFVRLESARTRPGTGLGLALTAAVAKLHNGSLRLEDNHPGLRAILSLPRQIEQPVQSLPKPA